VRMSRSSKLIGQILRQSIAHADGNETFPELTELANLGQLESLIDAASFHRVSNYLYLLWKDTEGASREVAERFALSYQQSVWNHLRVVAELAQLSQILNDESVPWLVVKGPALAEHLYPRIDLRPYSDLDLVIQPTAFPEAIRTLEGTGYRLLDSNWRLLATELKGELHLLSPLGVLVDAHWNLINDARARNTFRVRTADLFEGSRQVKIGDALVSTTASSDNLVYLATHACLAGGDRLIWLKDIEETVIGADVEWDRVVELAGAWGVRSLLGVMLERTRRVLSLPLAGEDIQRIAGGRSWLEVVRLADRLSPIETIRVEGSPSRITARATRSNPSRSAVELVRRSMSWAVARAGLAPRLSEQEQRLRGSAYEPFGDEQDRNAFFASTSMEGADV